MSTTPQSGSSQGAWPSNRAAFEDWLEAMHPRLARFTDFLMPVQVPSDYSRVSLIALEAFLLDQWPDDQTFLAEAGSDFADGAVRYVGETLLRSFGGGWGCSEDPDSMFVGQPYVYLDTTGRSEAGLSRRLGRSAPPRPAPSVRPTGWDCDARVNGNVEAAQNSRSTGFRVFATVSPARGSTSITTPGV